MRQMAAPAGGAAGPQFLLPLQELMRLDNLGIDLWQHRWGMLLQAKAVLASCRRRVGSP